LQPYARWLAESGATPIDRELEKRQDRCPFCAGKPQLAVLYAQEPSSEAGKGAARRFAWRAHYKPKPATGLAVAGFDLR